MLLVLGLGVLPLPLQAISRQRMLRMGGSQDYLRFGYAVTASGDLNGDGYPDLAVGVPLGGTGSQGEVRIYWGGPSMDTVADLVITGNDVSTGNEWFGNSLAMGDFDGDGYDDLAVGAPYYPKPGSSSDTGAVFLYLGGASMDNVADAVFLPVGSGKVFGDQVVMGDLNGDGYDDLIVGDPRSNRKGTQSGAVYVYLGWFLIDTSATIIWDGAAAAMFGNALAVGDVNKDGFPDVVVGAPGDTLNSAGTGQVYIYPGGPRLESQSLMGLVRNSSAQLGERVTVGDFNGDGYADVAAAQPDFNEVVIYWGGAVMDDQPDLTLTLSQSGRLGVWMTAADLNRDGYDDLVVGDTRASLDARTGQVFVFNGGEAMDTLPDLWLTGELYGDHFGEALAVADFRGDGFPDLVVGAPQADYAGPGSFLTGMVLVYDFFRYRLITPTGGETWPVGALRSVKWIGEDPASLYLTVDGGQTWTRLAGNVGGGPVSDTQTFTFRVPHVPTRYAMIRVVDENASRIDAPGFFAQSDSFFQIKASVVLLAFRAESREGRVHLSWRTDPGPEDLAGYRIYREEAGRRVLLTREPVQDTVYTVAEDRPATYVLAAVNGMGQELELGRLTHANRALYLVRQGNRAEISFYVPTLLPGGTTPVRLRLLDGTGRQVKELLRGNLTPGMHRITVPFPTHRSGHYFLRLEAEGFSRTLRVLWTP